MFADDVVKVWSDAGLVHPSGPSLDVFIGLNAVIPDGDGPYTHVIPYAGVGSESTQNVTAKYRQPSAQVRVIATNQPDVEALIEQLYNTIIVIRNQTINSNKYLWIKDRQEPFSLTSDKDRARMAFNVFAYGAQS